jgi:hypothetical protein
VQQRQLQPLGQPCREALHIYLRAVPPLWLQEHLHYAAIETTSKLTHGYEQLTLSSFRSSSMWRTHYFWGIASKCLWHRPLQLADDQHAA